MKILLLFSALLFTTISFAQLHVQPNGGTDSYVFVNDQVLFVEQDVNLVKNDNDPTTVASIYLREGAQLIQGSNTPNGGGDGLLSVYQNTPDDNAWDYTYWSSPVGNPDIAAVGNQNFGLRRVYDALSVTDAAVAQTIWGHNGIEDPLTISERWTYRYPAGGPFTPIYASNHVPVGYGFTMKGVGTGPNHNQIYDFRGRPNNGDIPVGVLINEWTLSGNPYPSALDLNAAFHDSDNTEINSFMYWDEDRTIDSHYYVDNKGGYGSWIPDSATYDATGTIPGTYTLPTFLHYDNGGNPIGTTGIEGVYYERRFAPIGQGFMINADATGDNTVIIKNNHRKYRKEGNLSDFRRPGNENRLAAATPINDEVDYRTPHLRIYTYFEGSHFRDMVLNFSDEATDGYDRGFDALHPNDGALADAYFPIGQNDEIKKYVIQGVQFEMNKKIRIAFVLSAQTQFTVAAVDEVKMDNKKAYLFDQELNTIKQITGGEQAVQTLPAGTYDSRFYIVFQDHAATLASSPFTGLREQVLESVSFFQNNPASQLEVSNPEGYDIKSASMYDMGGKLVLSESNLGDSNKFSFYTGNLSNGVYLVKLLTADDINIDYKAIVNNR